ncbi:MAG: FGGY family carbohydrate kinase [Solirubrobacteraceae bacterium]
MSSGLLLGVDEGTTAVKAALFDLELRAVAEARRAVPVTHPQPGWVEQDPELILQAVVEAVAEVLEHADGREILGAGLDHQGESVLAWDAHSGRALTPVIVWQDKRQQALLDEIDAAGGGARAVERSGLPLDPYFSSGKLAWLLANDDAVRGAREAGTLRLGTVDAFLVDRLGGRFATDLSAASRTQLLAAGGRDWDEQLLATFGVRRQWLPALGPSFGALGELRHERWPVPIPLAAQLVDQQAALAGSGAVRAGELKATYGTGVFVLGRTREPVLASGLLPTVAWAAPSASGAVGDASAASGIASGLGVGEVFHALDGGVFAAGSLLDWLATGLGLAADAAALAATAADVPDSAGVIVLPALAGLGAPWWRPGAHGVVAGLHPAVGPAHVARAALEAIAWRVADIVDAIASATPVERVRVDGGLTNDETLLRIQADALGLPLTVGAADTTVLGAAMLAGVGAGVFASVEEAVLRLPQGRVVEPRGDARERAARHQRWRTFVQASAEL